MTKQRTKETCMLYAVNGSVVRTRPATVNRTSGRSDQPSPTR